MNYEIKLIQSMFIDCNCYLINYNNKTIIIDPCIDVKTLKKYNVKKCFYGHLHADSHKEAVEGIIDGIEFKLISSDYLDFKLATRMTLEEFADFVKKQRIVTEPTELRKVMQFKSKNTVTLPTTTTNEQIYAEKNVIGGREILLPIKKAIIAYLKSYGIVNDYKAYKIALDRFLGRRLDLSRYYEEDFDEELFFNKTKTK